MSTREVPQVASIGLNQILIFPSYADCCYCSRNSIYYHFIPFLSSSTSFSPRDARRLK